MRHQWLTFWDVGAWRTWWDDRRRWRDHRAVTRELDHQIRQARSASAEALADAGEIAELERRRRGLAAPRRPVSPAWVPGLVLLLVLALIGPVASGDGTALALDDDQPPADTTTQAPATSTSVAATSSPVTTAETRTTTTGAPTTTVPTTTQAPVVAAAPDGEMDVHFIDVGQGDATLLDGPDFTVLIDTGRHDGSQVVPYLTAAGVESIDLLVGTHPHADHIGQFPEVLRAFPVAEVWMAGSTHTTATFERTIDAVLGSDAGYHEPRAGETYALGALVLEVVSPAAIGGDLNDDSIAIRTRYGDVALLFTGDATAEAEAGMLARGHDLDADVLHVGHHGSSTSSSAPFLAAVDPDIAVYSAGAGNQYGHPTPEVIERIADLGIEIFGTDVHGSVVVTTDGDTYTVEVGAGAAVAPATTGAPTTTTPPTTTTTAPALAAGGCGPGTVDINTAGFQELQRIIHIGPDRAQQILDLRPFSSVGAMTRIKGIAEARLADIQAQGVACAG